MSIAIRNCGSCFAFRGWFAGLCTLSLAIAAVLAPRTAVAQQQPAAAGELREYDVLVKQSPVGKVSIRTAEHPDGTVVATTDTTVNARFFLVTYHYEYHGTEVWQNERLVRLDSRADDDGKKLAVTAITDARASRTDLPGGPPRSGPSLVMTSNYWRLPDQRLTAGDFAIIDSDTGTLFTVKIQRLGTDTIAVDGQNIACEHFRVSGDTSAELWFDGKRRLIRQQTVEQGHLTEVRLVRIRAVAARQ
ncbi:MAG TPA: DUF6134 family protein [Pirellulales bacterium]|nr:DUF6134 family protein [Pirellulales bacterium]